MALELTDANFQEKVLSSDKLTVIDFWAEWCGPCRAIGPVIEELSKEYTNRVNVGKVNVDHNPQLSINYGITSIPAILFIKGGKVVDKLVGAQPKSNSSKKTHIGSQHTSCSIRHSSHHNQQYFRPVYFVEVRFDHKRCLGLSHENICRSGYTFRTADLEFTQG